MAAMLQHLLIVGGETPALLHIVPLLLRAELQAQRVTRADEAIDLVGVGVFDLIVVRHPTTARRCASWSRRSRARRPEPQGRRRRHGRPAHSGR